MPGRVGLGPGAGRLAGSLLQAGEAREASAAGRVATLLTLWSLRFAWWGCGARCGVRDPGRCGPSHCWTRRGLGLGGGASLLGWERPAGQGGSGPAESPPRPTAVGGGPASPERVHLRAGPRPRAPRRRLQIPAPAAAPSQLAAKGRRAPARAGKEEERSGRGTVATPAVLGLQRPSVHELNPVQTFPEELRDTAPLLSQAHA